MRHSAGDPALVSAPGSAISATALRALALASVDGALSVLMVDLNRSSFGIPVDVAPLPKQGYRVRDLGPHLSGHENCVATALLVGREDRGVLGGRPVERCSFTSCATVLFSLAGSMRIVCVLRTVTCDGEELFYLRPMGGGSHCRTACVVRPGAASPIFRKEASPAGADKLKHEACWIDSLDGRSRRLFPRILRTHLDACRTFMEMEFHEAPTLRMLVLTQRLNSRDAARWVSRILGVLHKEVYSIERKPTAAGYVEHKHLCRIETRLAETVRRAPQLADVIDAEEIRVNGKRLMNVAPLVALLQRSPAALALLTPRHQCRIHGDLHFDNIIVDEPNASFTLVDPAGTDDLDVAYDLGKILHSCNSFYDLIHSGSFEGPALRYHARRCELVYTLTTPRLAARYAEIRDHLLKSIARNRYAAEERRWMLQARFAEAAHMCSVLPFHLSGDGVERLALTLYARGVELLNAVCAELAAVLARQTSRRRHDPDPFLSTLRHSISASSTKPTNTGKKRHEDHSFVRH